MLIIIILIIIIKIYKKNIKLYKLTASFDFIANIINYLNLEKVGIFFKCELRFIENLSQKIFNFPRYQILRKSETTQRLKHRLSAS